MRATDGVHHIRTVGTGPKRAFAHDRLLTKQGAHKGRPYSC